jgi:hypothetical protein
MGDCDKTTPRYTLEDADSAAGEAGIFWFDRGIHEGFRRVLASSRTMTREMLIQWLEHEVENGPR